MTINGRDLTAENILALALGGKRPAPRQRDPDWRRNFRWKTKEGPKVLVRDMGTSHIFASFRGLFNHFCEPKDRIKPYNKWDNVRKWSKSYVQNAVRAFALELANRKAELTTTQLQQLEHVARVLSTTNEVLPH
jgi:hypothetical protein